MIHCICSMRKLLECSITVWVSNTYDFNPVQVVLVDFVLVLVEQMLWMSWLIFPGSLNVPRWVWYCISGTLRGGIKRNLQGAMGAFPGSLNVPRWVWYCISGTLRGGIKRNLQGAMGTFPGNSNVPRWVWYCITGRSGGGVKRCTLQVVMWIIIPWELNVPK